MTISQWLGLGAIALMGLFVAFAFRQGDKVRRSDIPPPSNDLP